MSCGHDDMLRSLDAWATFTFLLENSDMLAKRLQQIQENYNTMKPNRGPHPWGPCRRCLTMEIYNFIKDETLMVDSADFMTLHAGISEHAQLDAKSTNYCSIKETREGKVLLKIRPVLSARTAWEEAVDVLRTHIEGEGGEQKTDQAPPGPHLREVRASIAARREKQK
eukprot:TRINITY_DN40984_c0_g2_i1.p2 TRINITY_DN40984_c0_g2~~TRINITY_DN40984_c0_g2_i1.p2  ORF type:complete len:168 (+),score=44.91 TRINITY_DN40984_c0_g2_i1:335-838(+)